MLFNGETDRGSQVQGNQDDGLSLTSNKMQRRQGTAIGLKENSYLVYINIYI